MKPQPGHGPLKKSGQNMKNQWNDEAAMCNQAEADEFSV